MTQAGIWILTSSYNDYDQHGDYFVEAFNGKPNAEQIMQICKVDSDTAEHILKGGGRESDEWCWYHLESYKTVHGKGMKL